jgi:putative colanic acid biosynthesis acetyltransferase WcaF
MPTDLSKYNNNWYNPGSAIKRTVWFVLNALFIKNSFIPFYGFKRTLLRSFGATIGNGVVIKNGVNIKYPWFLKVGDFSWIGENVWIDNLGQVTIGANVCISQGALLLCGNHRFDRPTFDLMVRPIVLEDGVWIGAQAVVCPGVICKSHSVLTVGSVASKSLDEYGIYQGNPCMKIKSRKIHAV